MPCSLTRLKLTYSSKMAIKSWIDRKVFFFVDNVFQGRDVTRKYWSCFTKLLIRAVPGMVITLKLRFLFGRAFDFADNPDFSDSCDQGFRDLILCTEREDEVYSIPWNTWGIDRRSLPTNMARSPRERLPLPAAGLMVIDVLSFYAIHFLSFR